jgi:hypothetical protein
MCRYFIENITKLTQFGDKNTLKKANDIFISLASKHPTASG